MMKKKKDAQKEVAEKVIENAAEEKAEGKSASFIDDAPRSIVAEEALEAILFAAGHPISYATLARVFNMTPSKVRDMVLEYSLKYNDPQIPRGVILLVYKDSCQLCTKKYYLNEIRDALGIRKSGTLSTSSMEALAIVAYNQPVTRAFVDTLRRADSSYAMNNLLDRGLIESQGRLDAPGRPMLYGTTSDFLRCFGLKDLSELPQTTEEIQSMFANTSNVPEEENENGEQTELDIEAVLDGDERNTEAAAQEESLDDAGEDMEPSADDHVDFGDEEDTDETEQEETLGEADEYVEPSADDNVDYGEDGDYEYVDDTDGDDADSYNNEDYADTSVED